MTAVTIVTIVVMVVVLISFNALYVAAEFAAVSSRKTKIHQMAEEGNSLARILSPVLEDTTRLDTYVAACQIGITASSLALGAYGQQNIALAIEPWLSGLGGLSNAAANSISALLVLIGLTILQVVIGELLPKSIALQKPEQVAMFTVIPTNWTVYILRPAIWFLNGSGRVLLRAFGLEQAEGHGRVHTPQEIEFLITESHAGGVLDAEERRLLRNAFRLRDLTARQVMVPRTRIVAAPAETTVEELLALAIQAGFSRIPLYEETIDNIIGFVHVKELFRLRMRGQDDARQVLRKARYIPETMVVADIWHTLNQGRQYLAIVFDEYGGTAGMLTFEDLLEEVFGELQDEFDDELPLVSSDKSGRIYLKAELLVADINEYLELNLPDDEVDTVGGLVFSVLGRPPIVGDEVQVSDPPIMVRVEALDGHRIEEVSLQLPVTVSSHLGEWEVGAHE